LEFPLFEFPLFEFPLFEFPLLEFPDAGVDPKDELAPSAAGAESGSAARDPSAPAHAAQAMKIAIVRRQKIIRVLG